VYGLPLLVAVAVPTVGGVLSIWIGLNAVPDALLPALSEQLGVTEPVEVSLLRVWLSWAFTTPEPPVSEQSQLTVTSWFVQVPAVYGLPLLAAATFDTAGGDLSMFTWKAVPVAVFPALSAHEGVAVPVEVRVVELPVLPDPLSVQSQLTRTSSFDHAPAVYTPSDVPSVFSFVPITLLMVGAVVSSRIESLAVTDVLPAASLKRAKTVFVPSPEDSVKLTVALNDVSEVTETKLAPVNDEFSEISYAVTPVSSLALSASETPVVFVYDAPLLIETDGFVGAVVSEGAE
jgi:hypothetical protein